MSEPEIAIVFTPEAWVEELHRHCTDHGGARVRQIVMDPALALEEQFDVLVVSHRWPALTHGFVEALHDRNALVLGVYDRGEPIGREHLTALDVDRVVAADDGPVAVVRALIDLAPRVDRREARVVDDGVPAGWFEAQASAASLGGRVLAVGGPGGGGVTETAIAIARLLSLRSEPTVLVDAHEIAPSIAQRLGLAIEPNLRSAIDAVAFGLGELERSLAHADPRGPAVLAGLPNVAAWSQVRPGEVLDVLERLARVYRHVVTDLADRLEDVAAGARGRYALTRGIVGAADVLVGVTVGTPVGVARLLAWIAEARLLNAHAPVHVLVNRAPAERFRRGELEAEIVRTFPPESLHFAPGDRRVGAAAWAGALVDHGPFAKAVEELARAVRPPLGAVRATRRRRGRPIRVRTS